MSIGATWGRIAALAVACLGFGLVSGATPRQAPAPQALPDVQKLGPQIGEQVPDFALPDQRGQSRTMSSLMGPRGLVLVFNRSVDW